LPATSALAVSVHGESMQWSTEAHLLATAVDVLQLQIWQQAKKGTKRPKPLPRPGAAAAGRTFGKGGGLTPSEFEARRAARLAAARGES